MAKYDNELEAKKKNEIDTSIQWVVNFRLSVIEKRFWMDKISKKTYINTLYANSLLIIRAFKCFDVGGRVWKSRRMWQSREWKAPEARGV